MGAHEVIPLQDIGVNPALSVWKIKLFFFNLKIKFYWFKGDKISAIKVIAYYIPFVVVAKKCLKI